MYDPIRSRVYRENNREKIRKVARETYVRFKIKVKADILREYGGKCTCCNETISEFLTIDHINNNGAEHRRSLSGTGKAGTWFYKWLMRNNYPKDFQLLCWNCNWGKRLGICPHKK